MVSRRNDLIEARPDAKPDTNFADRALSVAVQTARRQPKKQMGVWAKHMGF
jgi:hypothetical protein